MLTVCMHCLLLLQASKTLQIEHNFGPLVADKQALGDALVIERDRFPTSNDKHKENYNYQHDMKKYTRKCDDYCVRISVG